MLGTTSCVREMADPVEKYDRYLVETEDISFDETRTVADNQGRVLWHNGDLVSVFEKVSYQSRYKYLGGNGTSGGELSLESTPETATGTEVSYYYAAYPYELENGMDNDENLILRFHQEQVSGYRSFGRGDNLMVSISENNRFHFKNAGSYLVLRLWGEGFVSSITMTGNSGEYISGDVKVAQSMNGDPEITVLSGRQYSSMGYKTYTSITLDCVDPEYGPVELVNDSNQYEEFWFVVPPTTFENGASFLVTDPNGRTCTVSIGSRFTLTRGRAQPARREVVFTTEVTSVSLDATEATLAVGNTKTLVATVLPENATDKTVTWTSSDETVATVDENGKVTAVAEGTAIITATAGDKSVTCTVTVTPVLVSSITLNKTTASVNVGGTTTLTATVTPSNAADKTVTWSSSDTEVATVSTSGMVTGVKAGTATITATAHDGSGVTATCAVTVSNVAVTSVTLNKATLSLTKGSTETLTATVSPSNSTDKMVTWTSSNTAVATVDSNGKVTAVGGGSAMITATAGGKSATCAVTVTVPVTGVTLNKTSTSIYVGSTETLTETVAPANASNKDVTWSSSNETVATVDANGTVTAKAAGTAKITVRTVDGNKTAECTVMVSPVAVTSVTLNTTTLTFNSLSGTQTLTATVKPDNATDKVVTWSSSNTSVATVANGVVTPKGSGTAKITATAGSKSAECTVTVNIPVTGVTLSKTTLNLYVGENETLTASVLPTTASNQNVTWSSNRTSVATVSGGVVTAKANGTAVITVTTEDGNKKATCTVTVTTSNVPSGMVDMGVSVYWAKMNLGATSETEKGTSYSSWMNSTTGLDNARSGGTNWRTPTQAEWDELTANCMVVYDYDNEYVVLTSKTTGQTMLLPGTCYDDDDDLCACYWTSKAATTIGATTSYWIKIFDLFNDHDGWVNMSDNYSRIAIRPVVTK